MTTTNYAWSLPIVGGNQNQWGTMLNNILTDIDAKMFARTGGTISGNVSVAGTGSFTGASGAYSVTASALAGGLAIATVGRTSDGMSLITMHAADGITQNAKFSASAAAGLAIDVGGATRATIDAIGNLLVGVSAADQGKIYVRKDSTTAEVIQIQNESATGKMLSFRTNGNTQVGSISFTVSTVTYNTTSDYRLKNNIRPADAKRFMEIEFVDFEWTDGRHDCGVIAHQLAKVYPGLVLGEKDATEIRDVEIKPAIPAVSDRRLMDIPSGFTDEEIEQFKAAVENYELVEVTPEIPAVTEKREFPVYQQVNYTGLISRTGVHVQALQRTVDAQAETIAALIVRIEALEARA